VGPLPNDTPLLDGLSPPQRRRLLRAAEPRELADGEVLVGQGELGGDLFLVEHGALEARDGTAVLSRCQPGQLVGEIAFLDGGPRSAALVARGPTRVLAWARAPLQALLAGDPALEAAVLSGIALQQARSMRRLTAGVPPPPPQEVVLDGGVFVEPDSVLIRPDGERVALTPTETRLLAYLLARPSRTISHRTLLDEVWGYSRRVHTRTVYATVHRLRAKVEADPTEPRHLVSVPGRGYRFEP
jgi:CRP-like cAMP-binding protein